jgi:hypothetical protein
MRKMSKKVLSKYLSIIFVAILVIAIVYGIFVWTRQKSSEDELSEYIKKKEFIIFDENFHVEEKANITYRWLSKNATITLVVPYDQVVKLEFISWSYNIPRDVKIYLNDYMLTELNLTKNRTNYISPFVYLKKGLYKLKFLISEDCRVPALVEGTEDTRCLSIGLSEFKKLEVDNLLVDIDTPGWHGPESYYGKPIRWMKEKGIIKLINLEKGSFNLEFFAFSFYFDRELKVYVDENLVHTSKITPDGSDKKIKMSLNPGLHIINFDVGSCDYPSRLGVSADQRCLSIAIVKPIIYRF